MTANLEYILYGLAVAAVVGVIFAFKRDALVRKHRMKLLSPLLGGDNEAALYLASLSGGGNSAQVNGDDYEHLFRNRDRNGCHISPDGEPYYGSADAPPPSFDMNIHRSFD